MSQLIDNLLDKNHKPTIDLYTMVIFLTFSTITLIYTMKYIADAASDSATWNTFDKTNEFKRGIVVNAMTSILLTILLSFLQFTLRVDRDAATILMSTVFANTIKFITEASFVTNDGWQTAQTEGMENSIRKSFQSLNSNKFTRYIVVILLDTIVISSLLFSTAKYIPTLPFFRHQLGNFPVHRIARSILQTITNFLVLFSYSNSLRLEWVYGGSTAYNNTTLFIIIILAYLIFISINTGNKGLNKNSVKLFMTYAMLITLSIISATRSADAVSTENGNLYIGLGIFMVISIVCIGGLIMTSSDKIGKTQLHIGIMILLCTILPCVVSTVNFNWSKVTIAVLAILMLVIALKISSSRKKEFIDYSFNK